MHEVKTDRTERKSNIWGIAWSFSSCQPGTSSRWTDFKRAMAELGEKQQMLNNFQHDCVSLEENMPHAKSLQSCPAPCDPMNCSPPGSSVHGIFQAGVLERVAISFSKRIFLTQGSIPGLLHWQEDSLPSEPPGKTLVKIAMGWLISLCRTAYPALKALGSVWVGESWGHVICLPSGQVCSSQETTTGRGRGKPIWEQLPSQAPCADHQFLKAQMVFDIFLKHEAPALKVGFSAGDKISLLVLKIWGIVVWIWGIYSWDNIL